MVKNRTSQEYTSLLSQDCNHCYSFLHAHPGMCRILLSLLKLIWKVHPVPLGSAPTGEILSIQDAAFLQWPASALYTPTLSGWLPRYSSRILKPCPLYKTFRIIFCFLFSFIVLTLKYSQFVNNFPINAFVIIMVPQAVLFSHLQTKQNKTASWNCLGKSA